MLLGYFRVAKKRLTNSTRLVCLLSLLFILVSCDPAARVRQVSTTVSNKMTVAAFRPDEGKYYSINFLESARFYRLEKDANPGYLELLKESERGHFKVLVTLASEASDEIVRVERIEGK